MYLPSSRRRINCEDAIRVGADSVFHGRRSPPTSNLPRPSWNRASSQGLPGLDVLRAGDGGGTRDPRSAADSRPRMSPPLVPDTPQRRPPCPSRSRCRTHRRYTRQPSRPIYRLIGISRVCRPEAERASRPAMWRRSVGLRMRFLLSSATVLGDLRTDPVRPQQVSCHSCDGGQRSPDGWVLPSAPPGGRSFDAQPPFGEGFVAGLFDGGTGGDRVGGPPALPPLSVNARAGRTRARAHPVPAPSVHCSVSAAHHVSVAARRPRGEGAGEFPGNLDSCPVGVTKTRTGRRYLVYLSITVE